MDPGSLSTVWGGITDPGFRETFDPTMHRVETPLTKLLNVSLPVISAPMAFAATADLASAVTAASAFGFMGAGFLSSEELKRNFQVARKKLNIADNDPVPIGIGFIGWILDKTEVSEDPRIIATLEEKPIAIWFAFGDDLGKYISQVRAYDAQREHKTVIFVNVNSVEGARRAANEWKVDVIVAQGIEAGGHGGSDAPPLISLLQAVLQALPNGPPVVAAGGVSTGSQIAALLTMGAAGVVLGTRFLFSTECIYPPEKKELLLEAGLNATVRTLAFDEVGRTMGWPAKHDGRAISNQIIQDVNDGLDLEERLRRFDESAARGDSSRLIVWAGVGVGLTDKISSAQDIVSELKSDMYKALELASRLIA
ncbi:putative nitronate monooxygenase [Lyophyllum shimeji]|uniref:Nitronate monooxygenase n=1 Tax=Lyophyllum shimeji TaxID=47721 RepID=A0A9P3URU6_LYOSH|nr:putative nitronate monooxygenase [Lyophyllum shimeji]